MDKGIRIFFILTFLLLSGCKEEISYKYETKTVPQKGFLYDSFSKKLLYLANVEEIEKSFSKKGDLLKSVTTKSFIQLSSKNGERSSIEVDNFIVFDPRFSKGIIEDASNLLLKGEQNVARSGVAFPLYKVGVEKYDWALLKRGDGKLYSFEGEGGSLRRIDDQIVSNGAYYKGERNFLILHPELDYYATMSKKGEMSLYSLQEGKLLFKEREVFCFYFHPTKKILYMGKESGIFAFDFEDNSLIKIWDEPSRVIRISSEGGNLLFLKTGGENTPFILKLKKNGKVSGKLAVNEIVQGAEDWFFLNDNTICAIYNGEQSKIVRFNLDKGIDEELKYKGNITLVGNNKVPTVVLDDGTMAKLILQD